MKTKRKEIVEYKTIYVSDDGLFESEDQEKVKEYEATCTYKTFKPVFVIKPVLLDYENPIGVYECENEQDFQAFLYFIKRNNCVSNNVLQDVCKRYDPEQRYWAAVVDYNSGDGPDYLYIKPLSRIACEIKGAIFGAKNAISELEDQFEEVKKLLNGEDK